ncbi:hypothetical protein ABZZ36_35100 [Actinacidiphila glaucinigra]|uniref:hypothetical protein n=1 Tax=Actinacidiphila glaucinigra TaxID=235986 RepID=UPI0033A9A03F
MAGLPAFSLSVDGSGDAVAVLQCKRCGSTQVQSLELYVATMDPGSALKKGFAQPAEEKAALVGPLLVTGFGVALLVSGVILPGLLVTVGGAVWGARERGMEQTSQRLRAQWSKKMICMHCKEPFLP